MEGGAQGNSSGGGQSTTHHSPDVLERSSFVTAFSGEVVLTLHKVGCGNDGSRSRDKGTVQRWNRW